MTASLGQVPGGYRVEVFAEQDSVTSADLVALWVGEGVLTQPEAERRVAEVLVVATAPSGRVVGASTAFLGVVRRLGAELWHVRVFVAAAHRQAGLAEALALRGRAHLIQRHADGVDRRGIGILYEVQSEVLRRHDPGAVWTATRAVFIGENERGDHVRVVYFPGAPAPEPYRRPVP